MKDIGTLIKFNTLLGFTDLPLQETHCYRKQDIVIVVLLFLVILGCLDLF